LQAWAKALGAGGRIAHRRKEPGVKLLKAFLVPVLCASLMVPALPVTEASAAPLPKPAVSSHDGITFVDRRGRGGGWRHHGRHRGDHGSGAAAIIGAIIAGTLIAAAIREGRAHEEDIERCAEEFYGFDPETGTYINRYGEERICPYLR
jgi:hypothetical protein